MSDASDIARYFVAKTGLVATSHLMSRITRDSADLIESGYAKEDIIKAIDFAHDVKKVNMYSFGFIVIQIHKIMHDMRIHEELQKVKSFHNLRQSEVKDDGKSSERNRKKLERFGTKSRFGTELTFDLLKES